VTRDAPRKSHSARLFGAREFAIWHRTVAVGT
jgi:hypothetical protein